MLKLTLVTPTKRAIMGEEVDELFVPAFKGELNILPGHATLVTALSPGVLRLKKKGATAYTYAAISWGYCEVSNDNVHILAETVEMPKEIDAERAKAAIQNSESKMSASDVTPEDLEKYRLKLARAQVRLEVAEHKYLDS